MTTMSSPHTADVTPSFMGSSAMVLRLSPPTLDTLAADTPLYVSMTTRMDATMP